MSVQVVTHRQLRRLVIRFRGARLSFALCGCPPLASAIEAAGLIRWAWDVPVDDSFPAILAALR
jgi:hypothetical protein